jgi:hypothetical protein
VGGIWFKHSEFEKFLLVGVVMAAVAQPEVSRAHVHRGGHIKACGRRPLPRNLSVAG